MITLNQARIALSRIDKIIKLESLKNYNFKLYLNFEKLLKDIERLYDEVFPQGFKEWKDKQL